MTNLKEHFNKIIPINRKERFYTATVLPQLICSDNFNNLKLFFELIPNFPTGIQINPNVDNNNILFLTEYSLKEALVEDHFKKLYSGDYKTKETPDVVILITEPKYYLILVEAKMYSSSSAAELNEQMNRQRWIVDAFKAALNVDERDVYHVGLVPKQLITNKNSVQNYHIIYWEEIINKYENIMSNNYFFNVLKIAINKFDDLTSKNNGSIQSFRQNNEGMLTGEQIVELHTGGEKFWIGRNLGLYGILLAKDKETGGWIQNKYEVNFSSEYPPNRNWFSSSDFVQFMKGNMSSNNISSESIKINSTNVIQANDQTYNNIFNDNNEWHFSHLGEDYFRNIAKNICGVNSLDVPISEVYIGKSGEPYIKKRQGRNVNPNWCVKLLNGKAFKCRSSNGEISVGLYNRSNCKVFNWNVVKEYFNDRLKTNK